MVIVSILDYGAGNVRSVKNALISLGYSIRDITCTEDINNAEVLIFPGVGNFDKAMEFLTKNNYVTPLRRYIQENRRFFGMCLGLQTLFEASEECPGVEGLSIIKGTVMKFPNTSLTVPHIGWNGINLKKNSSCFNYLNNISDIKFYFVHSYRALQISGNEDWILSTTNYGDEEFISSIQKGNVMATQFHPEKSGTVGLAILRGFLETSSKVENRIPNISSPTTLTKRVIACLDVRTNDEGDLVVTKGDQYDVRGGGEVRNMGKPVDLCKRYYDEGADEIVFLNICSFRECPLKDLPMIKVLEKSSESVFVPLTVGGGITSLEVASLYFRAGADKVSIGSEAVYEAQAYIANGKIAKGKSLLETISKVYGKQAIVVSIDPKRVYIKDPSETKHHSIQLTIPGPNGEKLCWYQATVRGGRETRDIDAIDLAQACEALGAGEILLNCVDMDGQKNGFDHDLIKAIKMSVTIPVVASSGAGSATHFTNVFKVTNCDAALAAGIFHRNEVPIEEVKKQLNKDQISIRMTSISNIS